MKLPSHNSAETSYQDSLVRTAVLKDIDHVLENFGLNSKSVLGELGYEIHYFYQDENRSQFDEVARILEHCVIRTGCEYFGLVLAAYQNIDFLGSLGLLMQTSPTLKEAFLEFSQVLHVHTPSAVWEFFEGEKNFHMEFSYLSNSLTTRQHRLISQLGMAQAYRVLQNLSESQVFLEAVYFSHEKPACAKSYQKFFGCPVFFGGETNRLLVDKRIMLARTKHWNDPMHKIIKEKIVQSAAFKKDASLSQKVKIVIRNQLGKENCTLCSVSLNFGCDKRTLQRHIKRDSGKKFRDLLEEVREEMAQYYLGQTKLPVSQVAFALGYNDPANFTRAFKQNFQVSPKEWRHQNQETPN